jgi:hypothetical protein
MLLPIKVISFPISFAAIQRVNFLPLIFHNSMEKTFSPLKFHGLMGKFFVFEFSWLNGKVFYL